PRDQIPGILEDCARLNIKGAILVPQGFADADQEGSALQARLTRTAAQTGIRVLGPNTLGVVNAFSGFTSSFMPLARTRSPIGIICQSGVFFVGSTVFTGLVGKGIDVGNACDVDFAEALEYFEDDEDIKIIFLHIEGLKEGRRFLEIARRVAVRKPIVAMKAAKSLRGAKFALSHSGSLAGDAKVAEAALRQAGLIMAQDTEEILDYTKTLLHLPLMRGNKVGVVTFTGAGGIILIDALDEFGLELAELAPQTIRTIKDLSPPWMPLQNPLDIWPALMKHGLKHVYRLALEAMLQDDNVDGIICIAIAPEYPEQAYLDATGVIQETVARFPAKPVVAWLYGPNQALLSKQIEEDGRIVALPSLTRAARALSTLYRRSKFLEALKG
ncbi:MAG: CoA-binding protein, partial [Pseudomonadota bacterium]